MTTYEEENPIDVLRADGLPGILVTNQPLRAVATEALHHLAEVQAPLYLRHGQMVRIQCTEAGVPYIEYLSEAALKGVLARTINFAKITMRGLQHVPPPDNVVRDILSLGSWPFPALDTIVE